MTLHLTSDQAKFQTYAVPQGAKVTPRVAEYVETRAEAEFATSSDQIARLAAKYRAIRKSMPKQKRSGDPVIRIAELEATALSIHEAETLRK